VKSNVTDMRTRAKETVLKSRYQRLQRIGELSPDHAPPEAGELDRSNLAPPGSTYLCLEEPPISGWQLIADYPTKRVFTRPNEVLLYRVLERFFGPADLLGVAVREYIAESRSHEALPLTTDWGFSFQLSPTLVAEVRSLGRNTRHVVRCWAPDASHALKNHERPAAELERFLVDLRNAVENNLHLFEEKTELQASKAGPLARLSGSAINVSREKYQAAVRLLEATAVIQDTEEVLELDRPPFREGTSEALLLGATTLFLVSLEAFVNLLYEFLLRTDLDDRRHDRLITRLDLDLRILSLHLFCRGFVRQPIEPDSDLWNEVNQLREFRNDLMHGNVTDEHAFHPIQDGIYIFYYAPFRDYRGPSKERQVATRMRRYTGTIDDRFVRQIRDVVDRAQEAMVNALEPGLAAWARALFDQDVVVPPPLTQASPQLD